ncbi:MAG: rod shape-determining protein MreC [Planctomycetaceae bacterium]|nr:rod shape-determining protein MreC [Planctomycetaceae bacterium]
MSQDVTWTSWLAVLLASALGFALLLAPAESTEIVRSVVRDAALPGLLGISAAHQRLQAIVPRFEPSPVAEHEPPALLAEREEWEQRYRELRSLNAQLAAELQQARSGSPSPFLAESGTPLFVPELIAVNVIGAEEIQQATQRVSFRRVVAAGARQDVIPSDYVVSDISSRPLSRPALIDQGEDSGLSTDQTVFAGRCVVGKIGQVGRWTSTVIPITDASFRGPAQLVRMVPQGLVMGPEGVLAGDGKGGCLLTRIPATEPVSAGDEVYTSTRLTGLPLPMYYGRVMEAMLSEGATHWEIRVQPADAGTEARTLHVLRTVLNSTRTRLPADSLEGR